ncbi:MAG: tRNA uridine-5-carboxymethylaminomethyl(34) synthesis GTPase MnmE [bacterium]|nr:tRNA uridine-5-carboxymethylaminomethyl(34) synthesis GTPase MnmE [bacterium]
MMRLLPNLNDPICALATVPGVSALAVVRLSGNGCFELAQKLFKKKLEEESLQNVRSVHLKTLWKPNGELLDQAMVLFFRKPFSYTGQDMVEFSIHGSPRIINELLKILQQYGARMATQGEFTLRAFWNGKITLEQAEGIGEFIQAQNQTQQQLALGLMKGELHQYVDNLTLKIQEILSLIELSLDFSEDDVPILDVDKMRLKLKEIEKQLIQLENQYRISKQTQNKITIALTGPVNAGKSSLLNKLLLEERAIVSEIPGTTRDFIDAELHFEGIPVRVVDTAGLRKAENQIEKEGIRRSEDIIQQADLILFLVPIEKIQFHSPQKIHFLQPSIQNQYQKLISKNSQKVWLVVNKVDKLDKTTFMKLRKYDNVLFISAKYGTNVEKLKTKIQNWVKEKTELQKTELHFLVNERHHQHFTKAIHNIRNSLNWLKKGEQSTEFIAFELRMALEELGAMIGKNVKESVLQHIFQHFCIGK